MNKLNNLYQSIHLNYKSWIILFMVIFIIDNSYYIYTLLTLFLMLALLHLGHYFSHFNIFYPFNCAHLYHHNNNNTFSHVIQVIIEFICILSPILFKYSMKYILNFDIKIFDTYHIIFLYVFYTTIHTINYSYLHVNNVHEYHHKDIFKNIGPDICDILFSTKHDVKNSIENTDHYIPNIIGSCIFVLLLKYIYNKYINNELYTFLGFLTIETILSIYFFVSTIYIFFDDIDKYFKKNLETFRKN